MRIHIFINKIRLWLETNLDIKEASLGILVKVEVNIKEVELVTQEVPWVVEFKMIGLVRKSSSR